MPPRELRVACRRDLTTIEDEVERLLAPAADGPEGAR